MDNHKIIRIFQIHSSLRDIENQLQRQWNYSMAAYEVDLLRKLYDGEHVDKILQQYQAQEQLETALFRLGQIWSFVILCWIISQLIYLSTIKSAT